VISKIRIRLLYGALVFAGLVPAASAAISHEKIPDVVRAEQIRDLTFGMFVCWSFSTFSGQEWTPTRDKDASYFRATDVDTDQWCRVAEFTYPILPNHAEGGADWFYSLPKHDHLAHSAGKIYGDYLGAVKYGNIFSLNVGPGYDGKLREVDVKTLREVGEMIRNNEEL